MKCKSVSFYQYCMRIIQFCNKEFYKDICGHNTTSYNLAVILTPHLKSHKLWAERSRKILTSLRNKRGKMLRELGGCLFIQIPQHFHKENHQLYWNVEFKMNQELQQISCKSGVVKLLVLNLLQTEVRLILCK